MPPRLYRFRTASKSSPKTLLLGLFALALAIVLLKLLLPFLLLGALGYGGWKVWQWRQQRQQEQEAARQAREEYLDKIFYRMVRQHHGEFTALDFAMETQLPTAAAKKFLHQKAIDFDAQFKTTAEGQVLYCFSSPAMTSGSVQASSGTGSLEDNQD
ncbi:hypothetical protein [Leptolyngbya ohadii]|uniref:hypothetical protein n=1 Tax=Leptolyngbya ohadii TaxID=1962290 RepID=UPI000B59CD47|nr:hypothetical protein [Leptolyngbya ohadii]